jgi:MscS family membrane protein
VITIPNSKIVNDPVENVSRRRFIHRQFELALPQSVAPDKVREALEILREILEEPGIAESIHGKLDGEAYPPRVYLTELAAGNLAIRVAYWFAPVVYWDYLDHAQRVNLRIFQRFAAAEIPFAMPPAAAVPEPAKNRKA